MHPLRACLSDFLLMTHMFRSQIASRVREGAVLRHTGSFCYAAYWDAHFAGMRDAGTRKRRIVLARWTDHLLNGCSSRPVGRCRVLRQNLARVVQLGIELGPQFVEPTLLRRGDHVDQLVSLIDPRHG